MSTPATTGAPVTPRDRKGSSSGAGGRSRRPMSFRTLWPFLAITFGLTWGLGMLLLPFGEQIEALFGELGPTNPVYLLMVYSPAVAALILVGRQHGLAGIGSFLRRLTLWRMSPGWWVLLVVGIPAVVYLSAALAGTLSDPFPFSPWHAALPAVVLALAFGPVEELGWRGFGLPLLQRRFTPLGAALIIGVVWATWHLPAFLLDGTAQSEWSLVPFFLGVVALSVIITPMFNSTRGSILMAALFHFQLMNPVFPDADPWDKLAFVAVAVVVVLLNRKQMLHHEGAVTDVLLPTSTATTDATVTTT
jgi:uncharacterized protein